MDNYGSLRWLTRDARAPLHICARLSLPAGGQATVEVASAALQQRYESLRLRFDQSSTFGGKRRCFEEAIAILECVPGVGDLVGHLWRATHLIAPQGEGYDVSHSDPELPFSIFVSASPAEQHAPLRLAESIFHECLHLQLTLVEREEPLILDDSWTAFSPWQGHKRPLSGLLHGTYVFVAVDAFWAEQIENGAFGDSLIYAKRRRLEIHDELARIAPLSEADGLSADGRTFARYLQKRIECRSR